MTEKREARTKRRLPRPETKQETVAGQSIEAAEEIIPKELAVTEPPAWTPKTQLGRDVLAGKVKSIEELFESGIKITEPGIVDVLLPGLDSDTIMIGGSTGKGGGIRRTPARRTARMHKGGRRFRISVMVVVGNSNGYVGLGLADGLPGAHREVVEKALARAKLSIIPIRRGCGSWECSCGTPHSIPFAVTGKSGSVRLTLLPAPKGLGLCTSDEVKKIIRLAGIKDVWCKSRGQTASRINTAWAAFDALHKLNAIRTEPAAEAAVGLKVGRV